MTVGLKCITVIEVIVTLKKGDEIGDKFLRACKQYTKVKSLSVNGLLTYSFKVPEDQK